MDEKQRRTIENQVYEYFLNQVERLADSCDFICKIHNSKQTREVLKEIGLNDLTVHTISQKAKETASQIIEYLKRQKGEQKNDTKIWN